MKCPSITDPLQMFRPSILSDIIALLSTVIFFQIVDVSCGGDHTLALTSNGEVFSFGTSSNGQLGLGTRILETPQPQKIKGI